VYYKANEIIMFNQLKDWQQTILL